MKSRYLGINMVLVLFVIMGVGVFVLSFGFFSPKQSPVQAKTVQVTTPVIFYRKFGLGSSGEDVRLLQKILNTDQRTKISSSGLGSPGSETAYFGQLTKVAVQKFQALRDENVYPDGYVIIYSGYVDDKTRNDLNEYAASINFSSSGGIYNQHSSVVVGQPLSLTPQDQLNAEYRASITVIPGFPYIDYISPNKVKNGETITISGRNFSTTTANTIYMTYHQISATSTDGVTIRVPVNSYLNELFNEQTKNLDDDEREDVVKKIPDIPLFISVGNGVNISNPYMIYFNIK
jgi:peptidoglycan hydrolase-like protein with peptidoglycan-binding domain